MLQIGDTIAETTESAEAPSIATGIKGRKVQDFCFLESSASLASCTEKAAELDFQEPPAEEPESEDGGDGDNEGTSETGSEEDGTSEDSSEDTSDTGSSEDSSSSDD